MNIFCRRTIMLCLSTAVCSAMVPAQTPGAGQGSATSATDKVFLKKAALGGYAEVQLGQLASQNGTADEVKSFAKQMVQDHTTLNTQLEPFAQAAGLTPPTKLDKKSQDEYDKLSALKGDNFDREYLAYMVKDHHEDLKEFRKEEGATTNTELKTTVAQGETVIQMHSTMADKLNKQLGGPKKQG